MLKQIKLTNFRAARSRGYAFTEGLQVVRGSNEAGKSTLLEAMMYALYGSRALRDSLANTVTYGEKDATLKVEALFNFDSDDYLFVRHKGGAEVYVNGAGEPFVTGQTEVTQFATKLIGADGPTATKLMLATQGNLRGALEQGPKATAEMIEDLADFDLFDYLIDKMGTELALGSSAHMERTLDQLQESLNNFGQVNYEQEISQKEGEKESLQDSEKQLEAQLQGLKTQEAVLTQEVDTVALALNQLQQKQLTLNDLKQKLEDEKAKKVKAEQVVEQGSFESVLSQLEEQLTLAYTHAGTQKAFQAFKKLPVLDLEFEGPEGDFKAHLLKRQEELKIHDKEISELEWNVKAMKSNFITEKTCPTCQQPIADADEHNQHVENEVSALIEKLKVKTYQGKAVKEDVEALESFAKQAEVFTDFVKHYGDYVDVDTNFYPPRITWKDEEPKPETASVEQVHSELKTVREKQRGFEAATLQLETSKTLIAQFLERIASLASEVESVNVQPIDHLKSQLALVQESVAAVELELRDTKTTYLDLHTKIQSLKSQQEYEEKSRQEVEAQVKKIREDIENLEFNNNLLKKVRLARPKVSDQLWNMTLAAVSSMFSSMRGTRSVVTKDKDGFKVNGESVAGLSGSTLDILGASIRVALIRTFIPNCPFVVYDEPFAAMDEERTAAMLAFIQSTGFRQTLLVTHEDVSEQIADNLITL